MRALRNLCGVLLLLGVASAAGAQQTIQVDKAAIGGPTFGAEALRVTGDTTVSGRLAVGTTSPDPVQQLLVMGSARVEGAALQMGAGVSTLLRWPAIGQGLPTTGTRSAGTKVLLWPSLGPTTTEYAIGTAANTLWASVPTNARYEWYTNTDLSAQLTAAGAFRLERGPAVLNAGLGADDSEIDIIAHGDTPDRIVWPTGAAVAPAVGTRSPGSRLVLYPSVATGRADYALGIAGSTLWQSVPTSFEQFRWYGGATEIANLAGSGTFELDKDLVPEQPYHGFIGYPTRKWLALHAAELWVETLVAQDTLATIGGRILVAPTTKLLEPFISGEDIFFAEHNNLDVGDFVYLEGSGRVEFMRVTAKTPWNRIENPNFELTAGGWSASPGTFIRESNAPEIRGQVEGGFLGNATKGSGATTLTVSYGTTNLVEAGMVYQFCAAVRMRGTGLALADLRMRVGGGDAAWLMPTLTPLESYPDWQRACATGSAPTAHNWVYFQFPTGTTDDAAFLLDQVSLVRATHGNLPPGYELPWSATTTAYGVTRDLDSTGQNTWEAGSAILNTGSCNDGFIDLYSLRGVRSGSEFGPTIAGNVRTACSTTADYAAWQPRWAIGNLRGLYGYTTDLYGLAAGNQDAVWFAVENSNGLRMMNGLTTMAQLSPTGTLTLGRPDSAHLVQTPSGMAFRSGTGQNRFTINGITGDMDTIGNITVGTNAYIRSGAASAWNSGNGFFLQGVSGGARALIGNAATNRLQWDGTNLMLRSRNLDIGIDDPAMRIRSTSTIANAPEQSIYFDLTGLGGRGWNMGAHRTGGMDWLTVGTSIVGAQNARIQIAAAAHASFGTTQIGVETSTSNPSLIELTGNRLVVGRGATRVVVEPVTIGDLGSPARPWRIFAENGYTGNCAGTVVVTAGIVTGCI